MDVSEIVTNSTEIDVLPHLLTVGFLTGSRAFGTAKETSDWDIVYPIYDSEKIDDIIRGFHRTESNYFAGFYISNMNRQINLIPVHPHEFLPWFLATRAFCPTLQQSGISNTIDKYAVFQGMISLFKATVPKLGTLKAYMELNKGLLNG